MKNWKEPSSSEHEIEVKILGYAPEAYEDMLRGIGATFLWEEHQKNYGFSIQPREGVAAILRLRVSEREQVLTYKETRKTPEARISEEYTTGIGDPEMFLQIMKAIGLEAELFEKRRRKYTCEGCIFDLDVWLPPTLYDQPYLEIEAPSIEVLEGMLARMHIPMERVSRDSIYELVEEARRTKKKPE